MRFRCVPVDVTTLSTQGQPVSVMAVKKDRWRDRGVRCMIEIFSCTSVIFRTHSSTCSVISSLHRTRSSRFALPPVFLDSHTTTPFLTLHHHPSQHSFVSAFLSALALCHLEQPRSVNSQKLHPLSPCLFICPVPCIFYMWFPCSNLSLAAAILPLAVELKQLLHRWARVRTVSVSHPFVN
jgi:hypothetical protein